MSNPERTAERLSCLCEAYGCPMLGTRSAGTSGGGFMCHLHAGRDPGQLQAITVEVNRNIWLAHAIRDIRSRAHNPNWRHTYARIKHDIELADRGDLMHKDRNLDAWATYLEGELSRVVKAVFESEPVQEELPA